MQGTTYKGIWSRRPLAALGKLTIAALIGSALGFATLLLTILLATNDFTLPLFIVAVALLLVAGIVAICAGTGATIQNYRSTVRQAPRWLPIPLAALGGLILGALLVSLLVQATLAPSSASTANGVPAVHMGISNFAQSSITIPKGSKLMLIDDGSYLHILSNGTWVNNTPHPATESGAPTIANVQVNGNSIEVGPFNTAGTYHIYCTVHPGMNLTIISQ